MRAIKAMCKRLDPMRLIKVLVPDLVRSLEFIPRSLSLAAQVTSYLYLTNKQTCESVR